MLDAISRFSLLKRAVRYTRLRFSTKVRNRSLPIESFRAQSELRRTFFCSRSIRRVPYTPFQELMEPPRPHNTSLSVGSDMSSAFFDEPFPTSEDDTGLGSAIVQEGICRSTDCWVLLRCFHVNSTRSASKVLPRSKLSCCF